MYLTISAQKMGSTYNSSVGNYVDYLEKENEDRLPEQREEFFDQENDSVSPQMVIDEIDANTAKLRQKDPKFYSIVVSPNQRELKAIGNDPNILREYTRKLMEDYAKSFHHNQEVKAENLKYYAKIEHERTYRGFDKQVQENAPYRGEIARLRNEIRKVERGESLGNVKELEKKIKEQERLAPHKQNGQLVAAGMQKEGPRPISIS
ncbi:MobB family relaxase [Flagellimonas lutimaris]|uniref:MobB family relaxase n=1 Tax=Flagellimonas lutimaris TaxID=475082 RepID=UPI0039C44788